MRSGWWKALFLGLCVGVVGLLVAPLRFMLAFDEDFGLGLLFRLRGPVSPPPEAVVVSIDRESSEHLGLPDNPDKWPRSLHARLTEILSREGAAVVSFDLHFIEPRGEKDDRAFAAAIGRAGNVILTEPIRTKDIPLIEADGSFDTHNIVRLVPPIPLLADAAVATAPFTLPRIPFKVSRFFTFEPGAGDAPSVPMIALQIYCAPAYGEFLRLLGTVAPAHAGEFRPDLPQAGSGRSLRRLMMRTRQIFSDDPSLAGRMRKALAGSGLATSDAERARRVEALIRLYEDPNNRYIDYYGPPRTIRTIPYHEALEIREGRIGDRPVDLRGKAVFVGLSEGVLAERKDSFYTVFSRANGVFIGGVEISATAFSNVLNGAAVRPVGYLGYALIVLSWGTLLGVLCRRVHVAVAASALAALGVLYLAGAWYGLKTENLWLPVTVPLFFQAPLAFVGGVVWNYLDTKKEQEKVRKAFEYYLPKNVVDQLLHNLGDIGASAETVYGVCLFTDAEHYTNLSETMDPKELGAFMNRYYEALFRPVKEHGGVVSNLAGDSMLAIWVSATPDATLRAKACAAAADIDEAAASLYRPDDPQRLNTRIGLHYGDLFLGNIGAMDRYQHSVMGDIVNTASRIEGLNKHLGTRVLVSAEVVDRLDGLLTRALGEFRLKGKARPIAVHELVCRLGDADQARREAFGVFAEGLESFRKGNWNEATSRFGRCIEMLGEDAPSRFYLDLCEAYGRTPPPEPWDGVVSVDKK